MANKGKPLVGQKRDLVAFFKVSFGSPFPARYFFWMDHVSVKQDENERLRLIPSSPNKFLTRQVFFPISSRLILGDPTKAPLSLLPTYYTALRRISFHCG